MVVIHDISYIVTRHELKCVNKISASLTLTTFSNSPGLSTQMRDSVYRSLAWGGLQETTVWRNKADTFDIIALNAIARDTLKMAPFTITGGTGTVYLYDATNLHMKKGCQ